MDAQYHVTKNILHNTYIYFHNHLSTSNS